MNIRKLLLNIFEKVLIKSDYFSDVKHALKIIILNLIPYIVLYRTGTVKRF